VQANRFSEVFELKPTSKLIDLAKLLDEKRWSTTAVQNVAASPRSNPRLRFGVRALLRRFEFSSVVPENRHICSSFGRTKWFKLTILFHFSRPRRSCNAVIGMR
jgi:hypothetical protein